MAEKEVKKEEYGLYFGPTEKTVSLIQKGTKVELEKAQELLLKVIKMAKTGGYFKVEKL